MFKEELTKELQYLSSGGSCYRSESAEMALQVLKQVKAVQPFLELETAAVCVRRALSNVDQDRLKDVTKMLTVVARSLDRKLNESEEVKEYLRQRAVKRKRKKLSLVPA